MPVHVRFGRAPSFAKPALSLFTGGDRHRFRLKRNPARIQQSPQGRVGLTLGLEFLLAVQASCAGQRRDCLPSVLFRSLSPCFASPQAWRAAVRRPVFPLRTRGI